jgi:quercetin dioxygenase-like cupin family protein
MGYILEGNLELRQGENVWVLDQGDSFYFPSQVPHSLQYRHRCEFSKSIPRHVLEE